MSLSFSIKAFSATTALLLACATIWAGSADDLIKKGDDFDLKLQASEAIDFYLAAEKLEPKSASLLLHIARQYRHLMADATTREEKLRLGGIGLDYALRAAALAPNDSEAQLSPAISYGKMVPLQGLKEQIESARRIKDAVDKAIELDPHNDLAWNVLGRWNKVLADVNGLKRAVGSLTANCRRDRTLRRCCAFRKPSKSIPTASCTTSSWDKPTPRWGKPPTRAD